MLQWHKADYKSSILAVQYMIGCHPYDVDFRELFYFVTSKEIARELGVDEKGLRAGQILAFFKRLGLEEKQVYDGQLGIQFEGTKTFGHFATASALRRAGIEIPSWEDPPDHTDPQEHTHRARVKQKPSQSRPQGVRGS
jgi:hypothetical protein